MDLRTFETAGLLGGMGMEDAMQIGKMHNEVIFYRDAQQHGASQSSLERAKVGAWFVHPRFTAFLFCFFVFFWNR